MKKILKLTVGVLMSLMIVFAFAGCGGSATSPEDEATASLDKILSALKSADMTAIEELAGNEDVFGKAEKTLGSEEDVQTILTAMFGHFDYKLGKPEVVDDTHINIPATVSNADMQKATDTWVADLMAFALSNPEIASDKEALHAKTVELLPTSVEKTASAEDGIVTNDVVFPMVKTDEGVWDISEDIDESVLDAVMGGFMTAINGLTQSLGNQ